MCIEENSVTVGMVTYANRWEMVENILLKLNSIPEVGTIIIIDNNSAYDLNKKISLFDTEKNIEIIQLDQNYGSAGGFKRAVIENLKIDEPYMLLLDDDTYIEVDAFKKLAKDVKSEKMNFNKTAYSFFRPSWIKTTEYSIDHYLNTFFEFSILKKIGIKNDEINEKKHSFSKRPYVPYAGLFMSKSIVKNLKLPIEDYYLYVDDTNFTFGLYQKGYELYAYKGSQLFELEESWAQSKKTVFFEAYFTADENQKMRANYNIRNRVNFEWNNLISKKSEYLINQFIYLSFVFIKYMPKNRSGIQSFREILLYIKKGKQGKLGKDLD